jgi:hypothetical protein
MTQTTVWVDKRGRPVAVTRAVARSKTAKARVTSGELASPGGPQAVVVSVGQYSRRAVWRGANIPQSRSKERSSFVIPKISDFRTTTATRRGLSTAPTLKHFYKSFVMNLVSQRNPIISLPVECPEKGGRRSERHRQSERHGRVERRRFWKPRSPPPIGPSARGIGGGTRRSRYALFIRWLDSAPQIWHSVTR